MRGSSQWGWQGVPAKQAAPRPLWQVWEMGLHW
jgi:hypothetical protein